MTQIPPEWSFTKHVRLSKRYSLDITISEKAGIQMVWDPDVPTDLTPAEMRKYRAARHDAFLALSQRLGGAVVVVE